MPRPLTEIRPGLSELLRAVGFARMADDVLTEIDPQRLQRYVSIIERDLRKRQDLERLDQFRNVLARGGYFCY